jgi:hypothetical protein
LRVSRRECELVALVIAFGLAVACSRNSFETRVKDIPRRFEVKGQGYILSEREPGAIDDEAMVYTADAGARTFNFKTRTVLRHLYVGRWESFDSLPTEERKEVEDLASGALAFIHKLEKGRRLLEVDQRHREILRTFLAERLGQSQSSAH